MIDCHSLIVDFQQNVNNLSSDDLENLVYNYRVCHLLGISLMMLETWKLISSQQMSFWIKPQSALLQTLTYFTVKLKTLNGRKSYLDGLLNSQFYSHLLNFDLNCVQMDVLQNFRGDELVQSLLRIININLQLSHRCIFCHFGDNLSMNYSKSLTTVVLKLKNENKNNSDNGRFKVLFLFTSELYVDKGGNCFVLQD